MARVDRGSAAKVAWQAARSAGGAGAPGLGQRLAAVPRLVAATLSGRYRGMGRGRLAAMVAAALYIVSPVDLVPEGLLMVLGLGDDLLVLTWLVGALVGETGDYLAWERTQAHTVVGEVVPGH